MTILKTESLEKRYSSFTLKGVNIEINGGEITALVGENGAGKSTTIGCLSGTRKRDGGRIEILGKDIDSLTAEEKERIAFCYDESSFPQEFTLKEIGKFGSLFFSSWNNDTWNNLLVRLSLPEGKPIKDFSKGTKAKAEIAYALSHNPTLLILDETTSTLDPVVRDELLELFQEFVEDGDKAILFSSHITSDLEKIADRIIFIHSGEAILSIDRNDLDEKWAIAHAPKGHEASKSVEVKAKREKEYSTDILISEKNEFQKKYPEIEMEKASIEDILLMIARGEEE